VASDGSGTNGLFTENLLREMCNPTAKIEDVMKRVRLNVRLISKGAQIPWESTSLEDDFFFNSQGVDPQFIDAQVKQALAALKGSVNQASKVPSAPSAVLSAVEVKPPVIEAQPIVSAPSKAVIDVTKKASEEEKERLFKEELALWEKAVAESSLKLVEDYLQRYPNGSFSQLAQVRLDQLLAKKGEKKVQLVGSIDNPFSKGSASVVGAYSIGDNYSFELKDLLTGVVKNSYNDVVTEINDEKIIFNNGERIIDTLGNELKSKSSRFLTPAQFYPVEYGVGNKWTTRYGWVLGNSIASEIEMDFVVKGRNAYKSNFGAFNTFEVIGTGYAKGGSKFDMKYLIDPNRCAQPLVFEIISTGRGGRRGAGAFLDRIELVSFAQKKSSST
jgi:hypothetical protein